MAYIVRNKQPVGDKLTVGSQIYTSGNQQKPQQVDNTDYTDPTQIQNQNTNLDLGWMSQFDASKNNIGTMVDQANQKFMTDAGIRNYWDDEQQRLDSALHSSINNDVRSNIWNAAYKGPDVLNENLYKPALTGFQQTLQNLKTPTGIQTILSQYNPGVSSGATRYDALVYQQNKDYNDRVNSLFGSLNDINVKADTNLTSSKQYALDRKADEENIKNTARTYVGEQKKNIDNLAGTRINEANQLEQKMAEFVAHINDPIPEDQIPGIKKAPTPISSIRDFNPDQTYYTADGNVYNIPKSKTGKKVLSLDFNSAEGSSFVMPDISNVNYDYAIVPNMGGVEGVSNGWNLKNPIVSGSPYSNGASESYSGMPITNEQVEQEGYGLYRYDPYDKAAVANEIAKGLYTEKPLTITEQATNELLKLNNKNPDVQGQIEAAGLAPYAQNFDEIPEGAVLFLSDYGNIRAKGYKKVKDRLVPTGQEIVNDPSVAQILYPNDFLKYVAGETPKYENVLEQDPLTVLNNINDLYEDPFRYGSAYKRNEGDLVFDTEAYKTKEQQMAEEKIAYDKAEQLRRLNEMKGYIDKGNMIFNADDAAAYINGGMINPIKVIDNLALGNAISGWATDTGTKLANMTGVGTAYQNPWAAYGVDYDLGFTGNGLLGKAWDSATNTLIDNPLGQAISDYANTAAAELGMIPLVSKMNASTLLEGIQTGKYATENINQAMSINGQIWNNVAIKDNAGKLIGTAFVDPSSGEIASDAMGNVLNGGGLNTLIKQGISSVDGIKILDDGTKVISGANGSIFNLKPDGIVEGFDQFGTQIKVQDGVMTQLFDDGFKITTLPDNTMITEAPNGTIVISGGDGTLLSQKPDGSYFQSFDDGSTVTYDETGKLVSRTPPTQTSTISSLINMGASFIGSYAADMVYQTKTFSGSIAGAAGSYFLGAVGSVFGPVGTMVGSFVGKLVCGYVGDRTAQFATFLNDNVFPGAGVFIDPIQTIFDLGCVICTELHNQKFITDAQLNADRRHGKKIILKDMDIYLGYRVWADPVVKLMKKSEIFSYIVFLFAYVWISHMDYYERGIGKKSWIRDKIINCAYSICRYIGRKNNKYYKMINKNNKMVGKTIKWLDLEK